MNISGVGGTTISRSGMCSWAMMCTVWSADEMWVWMCDFCKWLPDVTAECLKTSLLGLCYKTKWMNYAEDKVVSLYLQLFSLEKKTQKYDSVVKLLTSNGRKIWMLLYQDTYINIQPVKNLCHRYSVIDSTIFCIASVLRDLSYPVSHLNFLVLKHYCCGARTEIWLRAVSFSIFFVQQK